MWYKTPIQPVDPVIRDQTNPLHGWYFRNDFSGSGQDSFTLPPSQDESMWETCFNVMPPTQKGFQIRRGWQEFTTVPFTDRSTRNFYQFQHDNDSFRAIVGTGDTSISMFDEGGNLLPYFAFTPTQLTRMIFSRNRGYFCSGNPDDLKKWTPPGTASGWGIDISHVSGVTDTGPTAASTAAQDTTGGATWLNPSNALLDDTAYATVAFPSGQGGSHFLQISDFGFSVPSNAEILSVRFTIKGHAVVTGPDKTTLSYFVQLLRSGNPYGQTFSYNINSRGTTDITITWPVDLKQATLNSSDLSDPGFGIQFIAASVPSVPTGSSIVFSVNYVTCELVYNGSTSAISISGTTSGNVNLTVGRIYYYTYQNSLTGHYSDLSDASGSTGALSAQEIALTNILDSSDPQVDGKVVLATADGGDPSILYFLATIPPGTSTYTDDTTEEDLVVSQIYQFTDAFGSDFGVAENLPPTPNATLGIKHQGRIWLADGQTLYFSKSEGELTLPDGFIAGKYEESFPGENSFDISEGAETIRGLLSDGQTLYIGTESHIRRVLGNDPTNFQLPAIVHPNVGVESQETWVITYTEGAPSGAVWLTPDFKVMQSDFNTYRDIGHPVQDLLEGIVPGSEPYLRASCFQDKDLNLFLLAINTVGNTLSALDTVLVYDLQGNQWYVWKPASNVAHINSLFFDINADGTPLWLTGFDDGRMYTLTEGSTHDAYVPDPNQLIVPSLVTSWLSFGAPQARKILNAIAVSTDQEGTVPFGISLYGANNYGDMKNAVPFSTVTASVGALGEYVGYLAGLATKYQYYKFRFRPLTTTGSYGSSYYLGSYKIEFYDYVNV